ncbi:hypothetical protein HYE82_28835 [Streptomyces sp. BR123]|uniref:hypothetical protein n=1 Tax=Streptomyces sp. BR123 TaxID=2749828 RepID=UPI0015C4AB2A|nr:hypothetical protein [Streptomyces sp. BR123]NXY98307.1 hypothetical protein [Streptomyces sp. BR123]
MARHAAPGTSSALRSAGLTVSMAGAALAMAAGGAQAGELSVPAAVAGVLNPVADVEVNPLAGTGVDPLDNGIATKVADFPPVGTGMVTGALTRGPSIAELPDAAVGSLLGPLNGGG